MKINWRFFKRTGKTFFMVRSEYKISASEIECAVSGFYGDIKSEKDIYFAIKYRIDIHGSPEFWCFEGMIADEERRARAAARVIIEKYIPTAYEVVK